MIKQSREKKRVQGVIRALLSPGKDSKSFMASPSKGSAVTGETPVSGLKVSRHMWVGGKTPPVGSLLGIAPSPCTPPDDDDDDDHHDLMTPTLSTQQTPQHVPGVTPELRASLPTQPLTQWTEDDVAACLKILGREMAQEGTNSARDVSAFDAYAETFVAKGIDGSKFASISIPQLNHELGVSNFNHRLKIVSWIKAYLEVRAPSARERVVFFFPRDATRRDFLLFFRGRSTSAGRCKMRSVFCFFFRRVFCVFSSLSFFVFFSCFFFYFTHPPRKNADIKQSFARRGGPPRIYRRRGALLHRMVSFYLVAAMDYFVSALLKLAELDANYFDNVSPSTPELQLQQRRQDKIICPALALPDSPPPMDERGEHEERDAARAPFPPVCLTKC